MEARVSVPLADRPANARAAQRFAAALGNTRVAFDGLECGITFDDLADYVGPLVSNVRECAEDVAWGRLTGLVAAAIMVAIETERERGG